MRCTHDLSCLITSDQISRASITRSIRGSSMLTSLRCCLPGWTLKKKVIIKLIFSSPVAYLQVKWEDFFFLIIALKAQLHFWEWFNRNGINLTRSLLPVSIQISLHRLKETVIRAALHIQWRFRSCQRIYFNSSSNLPVSHLVRPAQTNWRERGPLLCIGGAKPCLNVRKLCSFHSDLPI